MFGHVWAYSGILERLPGFQTSLPRSTEEARGPRSTFPPGVVANNLVAPPTSAQFTHLGISDSMAGGKYYKGSKPLQRREAWAGNHCQSLVWVHCRRRTSSPDSSPSWRTGVQWRQVSGTKVPTPWRCQMGLAHGPRTRMAPWHRDTWRSSCHGCGCL